VQGNCQKLGLVGFEVGTTFFLIADFQVVGSKPDDAH
jgi:hypothetical protein